MACLGGGGPLRPAALAAAFLLVCAPTARAQGAPGGEDVDLGQVSLKRLLDIDVTSVSKRSERLQDVASSIYVITSEDIRRSGATRIQDVLRMAPGAWFADDSYTISANSVREGAHAFCQTILWILDGIPITSPVIGGIVTDILDLPLADIERIEVIKGPGGTIYGANAASGIISIFTKTGEATDGLHLSMEAGTQGYAAPFFRYGFEPRENLFLTAWGKLKRHEGYDRNPLFSGDSLMAPLKAGGAIPRANLFRPAEDDNQEALSYGGKWDWRGGEAWRWSGALSHFAARSGKYRISHHPWPETNPDTTREYYHPSADQLPGEDRLSRILAHSRLEHDLREGHSWFLQASLWREEMRWMAGPGYNNDHDIADVEFQDNLEAWRIHRFSLGANLRHVAYDFTLLDGEPASMFKEPARTAWLLGAFLQDEIALGPRWRLTVGAKAETWTLLGLEPEISPSARLSYRPDPGLTFWAAGSRSITTPSLSQFDIEFRVQQLPMPWYYRSKGLADPPSSAGKWVAIVSGGDVKPGEYFTFEGGNRGTLGTLFQWDLSAFYALAKNQVSLTPLDPFGPAVPSRIQADSVLPLYNANLTEYDLYGGEGLVRVLPADWLRLEASYCLLYKYRYRGLAIPGDSLGRKLSGEDLLLTTLQSPRHVGRLKAYADLPWEAELTLFALATSPFSRGSKFDYVAQRPNPIDGIDTAPSEGIVQLDLALSRSFWRDRLAATLWGRNLLAAEPYTEHYNQFVWSSYPHMVHWTFGGGLEYRF